MAPANDEIVTVPPTVRTRILRVTALLAFGCMLGVGVEVLARGQLVASWASPVDATPASVAAAGPPRATEATSQEAMGTGVGEKVSAGSVHHHHHHAHHAQAAGGAPSPAPPLPVRDPNAAADDDDDADAGDDLSAAMKTLTKAKEEMTIP